METRQHGNEPEELNEETRAALQEAKDIAAGRIKAKEYHSVKELMRDLNSDD